MSVRRYSFWGGNAGAYNSREVEILLAGPAGTGKSLALLSKCLTLLGKYPGCRGLFLRGTRSSLTQSGLVTWEDAILGRGHPVLVRNPVKRRVRQSYEFANGSEFVTAGLDDPGKTLSAQYDFVYIQEATEEGVALGEYETLLRLLRNNRMPFHQVMMDCNPTTPTHWLYKRQAGGQLRMYSSRHEDNPAYYDRGKGDWTDQGRDYLAALKRMTGARLARFFRGVWAVAEGLVYDGYGPQHLLPAGWTPPRDWPRVWAVDWGWSNPTALQFWALDPDGRMYLYREYYATHTRVEQLAKWAKRQMELGNEPHPVGGVCDHDPECQATFREYAGVELELADKADKYGGIELMQARLDDAGDGKPRLYFVDQCRANPADPTLAESGKPTCGVEELAGYVWDTRNPDRPKDEPVDKDNHSMDAMRYAGKWVEKYLANPIRPDSFAADYAALERPFPPGVF